MQARALEKELRKQQFLNWLPALILFGFCASVIACVVILLQGSVSHPDGTEMGLRKIEREGVRHFLAVKPDSGGDVFVPTANATTRSRKRES